MNKEIRDRYLFHLSESIYDNEKEASELTRISIEYKTIAEFYKKNGNDKKASKYFALASEYEELSDNSSVQAVMKRRIFEEIKRTSERLDDES